MSGHGTTLLAPSTGNVTPRVVLDFETRLALRQLISDAHREKVGVAICPNGWGTPTGYKYGCKCAACKKAAAAAQRAHRNRNARRLQGLRQAKREQLREERSVEIVKLRRAGETYADIASTLNVSKQTVGKVILERAPELIGMASTDGYGTDDCDVCGRTFVRHHPARRYCGSKCKDRAQYVKRAERQRRAA